MAGQTYSGSPAFDATSGDAWPPSVLFTHSPGSSDSGSASATGWSRHSPTSSVPSTASPAFFAHSLYNNSQDGDLTEYLAELSRFSPEVQIAHGPPSQRRNLPLMHSRSDPGLQSMNLHSGGYTSDGESGSSPLVIGSFGDQINRDPQSHGSHFSGGTSPVPRGGVSPISNCHSNFVAISTVAPQYATYAVAIQGSTGRVRTSSDVSVGSSTGYGDEYRSRSDSGSSSGGWGPPGSLHTPMTPADAHGTFANFKSPNDSAAFSPGMSYFGTSEVDMESLAIGDAISTHSSGSAELTHNRHASYPDLGAAQHTTGSYPTPPILHSIRPPIGRRSSESNLPNSTSGPTLYDRRSSSPHVRSFLRAHLQDGNSSGSSSRCGSVESLQQVLHRAPSATPTILENQMHPSTSAWADSSRPAIHLDVQRGAAISAGVVMSRQDREALLAPYIRHYLSSTNRFLLGERTVLVLSGKVAQKSYGAEKRFLCPPPSALLLGCSWWAAGEANLQQRSMSIPPPLALHAPTTIISMSGERSIPTEAYCEWMTMSGHVSGEQASLDDVVIAGRCVGKQLHVSEADEKTKKVEALVQVLAPGFGPSDLRHIGTFPSKPIKVISKPSKKRQSIKNVDLCIHHGTTISLFNRLRSQTVSTKYLCVSGPAASFPAGDWRAMSGMEDKPFAPAEDATCFVARTSAWDPFIIYLVDPSKPPSMPDLPPPSPPLPGYPRPPFNALPATPGGCPTPIYYNQPVVLQCLSTAVVSPVMVIRKVDRASTATGGASLDGYTPPAVRDMPVAPGEQLGDPVSQLHKVALEVMTDPQGAYSAPPTSPLGAFPGSGSFLACLGENVGVHHVPATRIPVSSIPSTPSSSTLRSFLAPTGDILTGGELSSINHASDRQRSSTPQSAGSFTLPPPDNESNDGGKVKRGRKVSAASRVAGRPRHRGGSVGSLGEEVLTDETNSLTPVSPHSRAWTMECGEPAVWTIVGCDVRRHTFWVPPVLLNSRPSSSLSPGTVGEVFTTPIPGRPIGYDTNTPIPTINKYLPPSAPRADAPETQMISLYGANLRSNLWVWFGDVPSPHLDFKCPEVVMAQPPPFQSGQPKATYQIILVRDDGIVFPTKVYYTDP